MIITTAAATSTTLVMCTGVIVNHACHSISFTKNGVHLGVAHRGKETLLGLDSAKLSGMVSVHGVAQLRFNLGFDADVPFTSCADDIMCEEEDLQGTSGTGLWLVMHACLPGRLYGLLCAPHCQQNGYNHMPGACMHVIWQVAMHVCLPYCCFAPERLCDLPCALHRRQSGPDNCLRHACM